MVIDLQALMSNPLLHMGLGMLAGNTGTSRGAAFANAMQGGLMGLQQGSQAQRQMMATQLAQQQFEAEEAQRALEAQQAAERQQAGMGLLGQAGLTPEQQAYYGTFQDPYAQYQESLPDPAEPYTLAPGAMRFGPGGERIAYNPQATSPLVQIGAQAPYKTPANYMLADPADPTKGVVPIPGGPATQQTQAQAKAASFANRMNKAEDSMTELTQEGFDPVAPLEQARGIFNVTSSAEMQQYRQAQADWVRAKLRQESGAVIGEEEMASEIRTYFPQFGDSPEVIAQKAQARKTAERNLAQESGGAYEKRRKRMEKRAKSKEKAKGKQDIPPPPPGFIIQGS